MNQLTKVTVPTNLTHEFVEFDVCEGKVGIFAWLPGEEYARPPDPIQCCLLEIIYLFPQMTKIDEFTWTADCPDFKGGITYEFGPDNGEPSSFGDDDFSVEAWINIPAPDLALFRFGPDGGRIGRFRWSNKTELRSGRCWWEHNWLLPNMFRIRFGESLVKLPLEDVPADKWVNFVFVRNGDETRICITPIEENDQWVVGEGK
jgi:hypothetical protein